MTLAVNPSDTAAERPLTHAAAPPGAVVVAGEPDRPGVPLLAGRPFIGGAPAAYVCRGFVCDRPATGVEELTARLAEHG